MKKLDSTLKKDNYIDDFRKGFYEIKNKKTYGYSLGYYKNKEEYEKAINVFLTFLKEEKMSICKIFQQKPYEPDAIFNKINFLVKRDNDCFVLNFSFNKSVFNIVMYALNHPFVKEYFFINDETLNQCNTLSLNLFRPLIFSVK